jgi:hypothetical protein
MASFVPFNKFKLQLGKANYNFGTGSAGGGDALKMSLTNTAPTAATDTVWTVGTYPAPTNANGYTAGGYTVTYTWAETGGVTTLGCTTPIVVTASGGALGAFRYVVLYDTISPYGVIGYWDYGSSITLADTETFTITPSVSLFTLT